MESQFVLAGITAEITKFHHVVSALQPEELGIVGDIILNPPEVKPYAALRDRLCSQYAESEEQILHGLISGMQLGNRKPSRLLLEMRSKVDSRISEELLKSLFIQRLPTHVQQILAISDDPLNKLAEMADGTMAVAGPTSSIHVINAENQDLRTMLLEISSRLSRLETRERSTSHGPERLFRRRSSSRESGAHKHCWYHRRFKERATKCTISQPIIGADFLRHYGLLVDIRHGHLVYLLIKLQTQGTVQQGNNSAIKAVNGNTKFHRLLAEFPSLVEAVSTPRKLKHEDILAGSCPTSLVLQPLPVGQPPVTLHCDVSMDRIRPFVPILFRQEIFNNLHALSLLGVRASLKMVAERYVWPSMRQDVVLWARTCLQCQREKVSRHTRSEIGKFELPNSRFEHVHIDLVGPLPPSEGFHYCLTCMNRFSKWPEAFPLVEISTEAVANAFYTGWISRFGPPLRLTTDQGTQFEASLFDALSRFLGRKRRHTTPYHPAAKGLVESFHRQLKAAIMAHGNAQ
ncbi:transposon Ty3-I Gag-Pol polyprotein [Nephila pilipes]|uniref:Transposon Ty3-I Gag-Pol polyprotein n=1 Tax=Nephila pilipes TaxID=299642 RepID=A0A8X6QDA6_NEPPI|nr:transposon Ty3-I Gag-Pol polyprotein [Nephila pilipes]